ncbi:MAG: hypothetical protein LIO62_00545 [Clostridiales bacterium]|nr:hypothetical protein [Clostridiales bacterium]
MADKESAKVNKKSGKVRAENTAMIVVLVLIAVFIFYECYTATHVEVETITAVTSTVYESIDTEALVIRDEHIIENGNGAVTVASVSDGEKVKVGGNIAMVFSSDENAQNYVAALDLNEQLEYYNDLESKSAGITTDVETIDKDIINDVNSYIRATADYSRSDLDSITLSLNDTLTRRQIIIGESIDFTDIKSELQSQIDELDVESNQPTGYVTTDESGIFSSYTDGCEELFDYDSVLSMDTETYDDYISKIETAQQTECLGKLVTTFEWYFCCKLSADDVSDIDDGDVLNVALKDSDTVFECEVVSGADTDLGAEETILVLSCSQMDADISSMRLEDIEIRYNEYTGFKVPSSAVHVDDDGNKIVYALVANQVTMRSGEIVYSTDDYVVFEYDAENSDSIRLYDQIITKGTDLHDGKVYT